MDKESLYFFSTNNSDSIFLQEQLSDEQKQLIKEILTVLIKKPSTYHKYFKRRNVLNTLLKDVTTYKDMELFIKKYEIQFKIKGTDFKKDKLRLEKKLTADYGFGLFGEMLFYTVIQYLMNDRNLLLSKISFITAPSTFSHGSDGLFCNYNDKILFFGEAKFSNSLNNGLEQALESLRLYEERLKLDKSIIVLHNRDLKNGYDRCSDIISKKQLDQFKMCIIVFILHGEEFEQQLIMECLNNYSEKIKSIVNNDVDLEIISFPIYDKNSLQFFISQKVENYDKSI